MREIIFLILFSSISIDLCFPQDIVGKMIYTNTEPGKRIVFLATDLCLKGSISTDNYERKMSVFDVESVTQQKDCYIYNTIGFMPINEDKVKVFLKAEKQKPKMTVAMFYKDKSNPKELVYSCNEKGVVETGTEVPFTVTKTKENIDLKMLYPLQKNDIDEKIVQCESVDLETKKVGQTVKKLFDDSSANKAEWIFKTTDENSIQLDEYTGEIIKIDIADGKKTGSMNKFDIFSKMRCDPEKLIIAQGNDNKMEYYSLEKVAGDADKWADKFSLKINSDIDSEKCEKNGNGGARMMYEITGSSKTKGLAKSIKCVENGNEWKYVIDAPPTTPIPAGDIINVWCIQPRCRMCKDIELTPNMTCGPYDGCESVKANDAKSDPITIDNIKTCKSIKTDQCKIMKWNDGPFKNSPVSAETFCDDNSEYKIEGKKVTSMTNYFPITHYDNVPNSSTEFNLFGFISKMGVIYIIYTFSFTISISYLFMLCGTKQKGPYVQNRENPEKEEKGRGGNQEDLRDIQAIERRSKNAQKIDTEYKKSEALKAAKKDKKKEDKKEEQSGDKKSDEKKPDEKKNEA